MIGDQFGNQEGKLIYKLLKSDSMVHNLKRENKELKEKVEALKKILNENKI
jgi:hypothetical protein